jgi:hypothetical protein
MTVETGGTLLQLVTKQTTLLQRCVAVLHVGAHCWPPPVSTADVDAAQNTIAVCPRWPCRELGDLEELARAVVAQDAIVTMPGSERWMERL